MQQGFYSNRTDFIRTAIRNQIGAHADAVKQSIVRNTLELGLRHYSREDLEAVKAAGRRLRIQVLGLASIAEDVTPELARETIKSHQRARRASSEQIRQERVLADRIRLGAVALISPWRIRTHETASSPAPCAQADEAHARPEASIEATQRPFEARPAAGSGTDRAHGLTRRLPM